MRCTSRRIPTLSSPRLVLERFSETTTWGPRRHASRAALGAWMRSGGLRGQTEESRGWRRLRSRVHTLFKDGSSARDVPCPPPVDTPLPPRIQPLRIRGSLPLWCLLGEVRRGGNPSARVASQRRLSPLRRARHPCFARSTIPGPSLLATEKAYCKWAGWGGAAELRDSDWVHPVHAGALWGLGNLRPHHPGA